METVDRCSELDALRGAAALAVFAQHGVDAAATTALLEPIRHTPLRLFWDGGAAVNIFFVLSGYVLSLRLLAEPLTPRGYMAYCVRRVARIYPALWAALLVSLALMHLAGAPAKQPGLSDWITSFWLGNLSLQQVFANAVLLWPGVDTDLIDPVLWTLVIEMKISLMLPLLLLPMKWQSGNRAAAVWLDGFVVAAACAISWSFGTLTSAPLFLLGAVLAKHRVAWSGVRLGNLSTAGLLVLAASLLTHQHIVAPEWGFEGLYVLLAGCGAALLILIVQSNRGLRSFFLTRPLVFLGTVSYGFYLLHLPLLLASVAVLFPHVGLMPAIAVALVLGLLLAMISRQWIERPAQTLGARLAKRLATMHPLQALLGPPRKG